MVDGMCSLLPYSTDICHFALIYTTTTKLIMCMYVLYLCVDYVRFGLSKDLHELCEQSFEMTVWSFWGDRM